MPEFERPGDKAAGEVSEGGASEGEARATSAPRSVRWVYLFGSAVLLLALGLINAWSIFVSPLEAEFGWTRAQTSLAFSQCMSMFCLGGIVTGLAAKKYSPGAVVAVCSALAGLGFFGVSKLTTLGRLYFP